ncbi:MAG: hypothetical protein KDE51_13070, partial [Anaerolineales bacterium]|nr:hypothetical protein [Anaerolineales bacterium]
LAVELATEAVQLHETYASDDGTFVYWQAHRLTGSFAPLQKAHDRLSAQLAGLPPEWENAFRHSPRHAQIFAAWQAHQPTTQSIILPRASAPVHGKLTASQQVEIVWTIFAPSDEAITDKKQRRLHQLQRLVAEAEAQGARPTLQALAEVLQVSLATVKRDLQLLKQNT